VKGVEADLKLVARLCDWNDISGHLYRHMATFKHL
jgi:hypothetical protein